jgi:hypothetical protein
MLLRIVLVALARFSAGLFAALLAAPSFGSDGAVEINQAKALAGGVTASDTPGFPVTIDAQGSYVLTGNLTVLAHGVNAIHVTSSEVSIDLSGFVITGPGDCSGSGTSLSCLPVGSGSGIWTFLPGGGASPRVSVRRGEIRGFGVYGVFLGQDARVEDLVTDVNGSRGIVVDTEWRRRDLCRRVDRPKLCRQEKSAGWNRQLHWQSGHRKRGI